jgi:carboxymethylenebutenolidase
VPVYRAQPEGKSNLPVILVISEIFGVHEHIADVARRFAKAGLPGAGAGPVRAPGRCRKVADIADLMKDIVSKTPDAQVMGDLDAVRGLGREGAAATSTSWASPAFCWGGRITWLYAAHNPKVKAGVAWYGRLVGDATANTPKHPIDIAPT